MLATTFYDVHTRPRNTFKFFTEKMCKKLSNYDNNIKKLTLEIYYQMNSNILNL